MWLQLHTEPDAGPSSRDVQLLVASGKAERQNGIVHSLGPLPTTAGPPLHLPMEARARMETRLQAGFCPLSGTSQPLPHHLVPTPPGPRAQWLPQGLQSGLPAAPIP